MANRRMFSKSITSSSRFLRMVPTARLFYYDLGMNADDDGYVEWYAVMAMTGAKEQDLQILQAMDLIKVFDDKVLIIKDWKENNYIQKDRYTPSKYLNVYNMDTECIQDVSKMDTQVRLGKDRLGKSSSISLLESSDDNSNKPAIANDKRDADIEFLREVWKDVHGQYPLGKPVLTRFPLKRLADAHTKETVAKVIKMLGSPEVMQDQYAPSANSPRDLELKWPQIKKYLVGKFGVTANKRSNYDI